MGVYTCSCLHEDKNPMSCVCRCIMVHWVEFPSTPPFISHGGGGGGGGGGEGGGVGV
jgi:hypothetical protein